MIGIGILCWRRAEFVRDVVLPALLKHTSSPWVGGISCNSEEALKVLGEAAPASQAIWRLIGTGKNLGPAGGKNRVIAWSMKQGHDHLFLFEDDMFPIKDGWDKWYLAGHAATGVHITCFQPEKFYQGVFKRKQFKGYELQQTVCDGGGLMSITKKCMDKIGGLHKMFEGHICGEHSEYTTRAMRALLSPFKGSSFKGCDEWIDGIDFREWRGHSSRPAGAAYLPSSSVYKPEVIAAGAAQYITVCKTHKLGELFQDPNWNEADAKEIAPP